MPSSVSVVGALPARFRHPRLLVVGFGDVGQRVLRMLPARVRVLALTHQPTRVGAIRAQGALPLYGDLDVAATLQRLAGVATHVIHLAPPHTEDQGDERTRSLLRALAKRSTPTTLVYGSTSGVYGDCGGAWIDETASLRPKTARARRRVAAEHAVREFGRSYGVRTSILRIPGIYAPNRVGGTPRERLLRGTPALVMEDDVFTNHIHADDLARTCIAALWRGKPQRVVHASDDSQIRMGEYFDLAAELYGLSKAPRITRKAAQTMLSPTLVSFMSESRRLDNRRLKRELRVKLRYPNPRSGLLACESS